MSVCFMTNRWFDLYEDQTNSYRCGIMAITRWLCDVWLCILCVDENV